MSDSLTSPESKTSSEIEADIEDLVTGAQKLFTEQYPLIQKMRIDKSAAVDTMGCHTLADPYAEPNVQRFQTFIALLLSPRTKDEQTYIALRNLRNHGLTIENMIATPKADIEKMIHMVGMWKQKAEYIKQDAVVLRDKFGSDIPHTFEDLVSLKGVGPKIANLTLKCCFDADDCIGVDVHVHRIANRLWIKTKTPEQTEVELKKIVPKEHWRDLNVALVGFGQKICKANPLCDKCLLRSTCTASKLYQKPATKRKR